MKKQFAILVILALAIGTAVAQKVSDYIVNTSFEGYVSIDTTGTQLTSVVGDGGYQDIVLPFDFEFGEHVLTQGTTIRVRADGHIIMEVDSIPIGYPAIGFHEGFSYWEGGYYRIYYAIVPFLLRDGQMPQGASGCWWQTMTDDSGTPMLVIEFKHLQHFNGANDDFNYQLRLHQNGNVSVHYGHLENHHTDSAFNFMMVAKGDGERVLLRGTWASPSPISPSSLYHLNGMSYVLYRYLDCTVLPDSGTVVTYVRPEPPCPTVGGLDVVDIGFTDATVVWVPQGNEAAWQLHLFNDGVDTVIDVDTDTLQLTELASFTAYSVSVRPICETRAGDWCDTVEFVTAACPPVSDVTVAVVSAHSVRVKWLPAQDNQGPWRIEYGRAGIVRGEGYGIIENRTFLGHANTLIDSLESDTEYDVYVATICGEGLLSVWSEKVRFTTWTDGVEQPETEAEMVSITPNPAHGSFSVNGVDGVVSVIVRDVAGRIVLNLQEVYPKQAISVAGLPCGAYYVTVIDATNTVTRKLIVR